MSTTTIRLPDDLKARVAAAAAGSGVTPHAFILEAIAEKTADAERRVALREIAERRYAEIVANGQTVSWSEMQAWLQARLSGESAEPPAARKLGA